MTESFAALLDESLSTLDMQPGSIVSGVVLDVDNDWVTCLLYTSPSPRDGLLSRMPSSA